MYQRHDPAQAFPLLEQSALLENDEAKFDLALLRLFGLGGVPKSLRRAMRWLKSASSKHRMSLFVLTSLRLVGMGNSNQHRLTCDSAVRSMKRLAEENPWTIRGLFEARQRYIDGDTIGSLSLYLQIAYTGVEVAQANAAHILTKPARGLASWIAETATMFTSDDDDVTDVEEEQQQHEMIIPSSSNARNEIAHDLYTSANRQGWKGAVRGVRAWLVFERGVRAWCHFRHELTHYTHSHYYELIRVSRKILKQQLSNAHSNVKQ